jgi:hypothetical protein
MSVPALAQENAKDEDAVQPSMPSYCGCVRRTDITRLGKSGGMLLSPSVAPHALGAALLAHLDPMRTCAFAAVEAEITQWRDPIVGSVEGPALAVIVEGCDPADGRISGSEPDSNHHFEKQRGKRYLERTAWMRLVRARH